MRFASCAILILAVAGLTFAEDKIDPAKLVGKWEDKNPGKGETLTVEFSKDGNVKLVRKLKGKETTFEGNYKVEGDKLTMKVHPGNKKKSMEKVVTIDKLTDDEFVQTDDMKATKTFARAKASTPAAEIPKTETPKTETTKNDDPLPKGTLPAADFKLTAGEFAKDFKKDEKAAQAKYKDKVVELSGTVQLSMGPSLGAKNSSLSIVTPEPDNRFPPQVLCISNDPEFFSRVGEGQTVRVRGKAARFGWSLESCELVERGPDTRVFLSADAMAKEFTADRRKADGKYEHKSMVISGVIEAIKPDGGLKLVELKGDGKTVIRCNFLDQDLVKKYKVGDSLKVYGQVTNADEGWVFVANCSPLSTK